jgi:hypothetical protein
VILLAKFVNHDLCRYLPREGHRSNFIGCLTAKSSGHLKYWLMSAKFSILRLGNFQYSKTTIELVTKNSGGYNPSCSLTFSDIDLLEMTAVVRLANPITSDLKPRTRLVLEGRVFDFGVGLRRRRGLNVLKLI